MVILIKIKNWNLSQIKKLILKEIEKIFLNQ
jgi:hypothetical protein